MSTNNRDYSIEVIRILAMMMIIFLHFWQNSYLLTNSDSYEHSLIFVLTRSVVSISVPLYVYISGWFKISFKPNKIFKLWKTAVFYGLLSAMLMWFFFDGQPRHFVSSFFPVTRGTWWFLSSYVVLMIIAPFINQGYKQFTKKQIQLTLLLLVIVCCFCMQFGARDRFGGSFMTLLTIYSCAVYHKKYLFPIKNSAIFSVIALILLLLSGYVAYYMTKVDFFITHFWAYNSILIIVTSALLFDTLIKLESLRRFASSNRKWITFLSTSTFQVYLIHESNIGKKILSLCSVSYDSQIFQVSVVLIGIVFCFLVCIFVDKMRLKFMELFYKMIEKIGWIRIRG